MPSSWIRFFADHDLKYHLGIALVLGFFFRTLAAYFAYGPLAMDDFVDAVYPALQLSRGTWPEINQGRSYLIVWVLSFYAQVAGLLGFSQQGVQLVRAMYFGLGLMSLSVIVGAYFYAKASSDRVFGSLLIYLSSLYFALPFLGTRAFGETVAMGLVFLGIGLIQYGLVLKEGNRGYLLAGWFVFASSILFRFQSGILFLSAFLFFCYQRDWRTVKYGFLAGLFSILAQALIDILSYGKPFASVVGHLLLNQHGGAEFGTQPWYSLIAVFLACTVLPFSLVLADKVIPTVRRHSLVALMIANFLLVHSLIPHKEERYLSPILPLLMVLLASAWSLKAGSRSVKRIYFPAFVIINSSLLFLASLSNTQAPLISPIVDVQSNYESGLFVDTNTHLRNYFFGTHIFLKPAFKFMHLVQVDFDWVRDYLKESPDSEVVTVLANLESGLGTPLTSLVDRTQDGVRCGSLESGGSLTDKLLYRLNPGKNNRRKPIHYVVCGRQ